MGLLEDYALKGAGFYAVFVALVPTGFGDLMDELQRNPTPDGVTADHVWFLGSRPCWCCVWCWSLGRSRRERCASSSPWREHTRQSGEQVVSPPDRAAAGGFLALAMWQLWLRPAAEVRMEGIALGPVQLSIHDLAAIFMIASLAVAVLTNTWPFFVFRDLWPSGRFFYGVIFLLMSFGLIVPVLVAGSSLPTTAIFMKWWEIALFAVFWGLETRRVARLRDNKVEKPDPDRGPLRGALPHRGRRAVHQGGATERTGAPG